MTRLGRDGKPERSRSRLRRAVPARAGSKLTEARGKNREADRSLDHARQTKEEPDLSLGGCPPSAVLGHDPLRIASVLLIAVILRNPRNQHPLSAVSCVR